MGMYVSNKNETVRLFKNPVLEYFSHIHSATPIVVYMPVIIYTAYLSFTHLQWYNVAILFLSGVLLWTIAEYTIHRWAFHYPPKSGWGKKLHFLVHGIHHDYPRDATRLVMPLLVSVPLAFVFYFAFRYAFGLYHLPVFSGFVFGYVSYDSIHYATHHIPMKGRMGKFLYEYHSRHHYEDDKTAYGVSNPLWDFVFGTVPKYIKERKLKKQKAAKIEQVSAE